MATVLYIENVKNPKVRFKVLKFNKDTGQGTLEGEYGAQFTRNLRKESLTQYGYKVVKVDEEEKPPKKKPG